MACSRCEAMTEAVEDAERAVRDARLALADERKISSVLADKVRELEAKLEQATGLRAIAERKCQAAQGEAKELASRVWELSAELKKARTSSLFD